MNNESRIKASAKYNKTNIKSIPLGFNKNTDSDIIEFLETKASKLGYIKQLIRADIEQEKKRGN